MNLKFVVIRVAVISILALTSSGFALAEEDELFGTTTQREEIRKQLTKQLEVVFGKGDEQLVEFANSLNSNPSSEAILKAFHKHASHLSVVVWGQQYKLPTDPSLFPLLQRMEDIERVLFKNWKFRPALSN